ncbi:hypothetical protein MTO96_050248, partial [Rhipicephalus appendiculatus]
MCRRVFICFLVCGVVAAVLIGFFNQGPDPFKVNKTGYWGTASVKNGKWNLLKHLLDDSGTKSKQRGVLAKALHEAKKSSSEEEVLERLAKKYLPLRTVADDAAYP